MSQSHLITLGQMRSEHYLAKRQVKEDRLGVRLQFYFLALFPLIALYYSGLTAFFVFFAVLIVNGAVAIVLRRLQDTLLIEMECLIIEMDCLIREHERMIEDKP